MSNLMNEIYRDIDVQINDEDHIIVHKTSPYRVEKVTNSRAVSASGKPSKKRILIGYAVSQTIMNPKSNYITLYPSCGKNTPEKDLEIYSSYLDWFNSCRSYNCYK